MKIPISYSQFYDDAHRLAQLIKEKAEGKYSSIYAIPRGGVPVGLIVGAELGLPVVDELMTGSLVVDDLIDSGKTLEKYRNNDKAVLYAKPHSPEKGVDYFAAIYDGWIEFPWEQTNEDFSDNLERLLQYLDGDGTISVEQRQHLLIVMQKIKKRLEE